MDNKKNVVDFADFYFEDVGFNYSIAKELAIILIDETSIDELKGIYDENLPRVNSSVGTGGSGSNFSCPNEASARACLANHFASYANQKYRSCYLSIYEYECLKRVLTYLEDDCFPPDYRLHINEKNIKLLKEVCNQFEKEYVQQNPEFLFTLMCR